MGEQRELLAAKLRDCLKISLGRPCFLGFLDESQAAYCQDWLRGERTAHLFWGGYEESQRVMLGFFPDYMEPDPTAFPLSAVTLRYRPEDKLGHRDFLGSFMGLGLQREVIGDILVGEGRTVAFVRAGLCGYFVDNVKKIGRVGVKLQTGFEEPLPLAVSFKDISGVIASERLDCMVGLLIHTSRGKAAGLISAGLVAVNHREALELSGKVQEGDIISVRGHGKFIIDRLGPLTGKGRLNVKCRKYQ